MNTPLLSYVPIDCWVFLISPAASFVFGLLFVSVRVGLSVEGSGNSMCLDIYLESGHSGGFGFES